MSIYNMFNLSVSLAVEIPTKEEEKSKNQTTNPLDSLVDDGYGSRGVEVTCK